MINKAYMINCDQSRWSKYVGMHFLEKSPCFDSRKKGKQFAKERGFKVDLYQRFARHFNRCKGAYGCFFSHYNVWAKIFKIYNLTAKNEKYLILEDDVEPYDIIELMANQEVEPEDRTVVNLRFGSICHGSEAYMIDSLTCKELILKTRHTIRFPVDKFLFWHGMPRTWETAQLPKIRLADWSKKSSLK